MEGGACTAYKWGVWFPLCGRQTVEAGLTVWRHFLCAEVMLEGLVRKERGFAQEESRKVSLWRVLSVEAGGCVGRIL